VVQQVLEHLETLLDRQPLKRKAAFAMRLETLRMTAESTRTLEVVERLLERLR
jgi:hypothetical protein